MEIVGQGAMESTVLLLSRIKKRMESLARGFLRRRRLRAYLMSNRQPWRTGYWEYREDYMKHVLSDDSYSTLFQEAKRLPKGYGFRLDARVVEIPWVLARLREKTGKLLDAGSSLNQEFILNAAALSNKKITILTLTPEPRCYWNLGVSYLFGDLRELEFRDSTFDIVVCISTIEHIGMDNTIYGGANAIASDERKTVFLKAVKEMRRMLKPGGPCYVTFPFGKYEDHGWFQQYDSAMTDALIAEFDPGRTEETIFQYKPDGWVVSDRASCRECETFDVHKSKCFDPQSKIEYPPDCPAMERAVACLGLYKT
jgi:SAM-dependent methyltransferase